MHEVQIYQAALAGADAVLLIVAALNDEELTHLMKAAGNCGIDALVEVHDEPELNRALTAGASFIGINIVCASILLLESNSPPFPM